MDVGLRFFLQHGKLGAQRAALWHCHLFQRLAGAFGDDALKREQLPPFAIQRAQKYYGHFFEKKDIWIIGDSANDIRCAHSNHLKCLAVASGHTTKNELGAFHPTVLVDDLSDTNQIIKALLS